MKTLSLLAVALLGLALSWTAAAQTAPSKEFLPPLPAGKQWKLIWQDEFDGTKLDETKWNRLGDHVRKGGWWLMEDAYLSGKGTLLLRTKKDGERFTCGALDTRGKFEHAFGYYVARLKMPKQPGHWPAFWLQTKSMTTVGDEGRDGTEIDIVEIPWRDGRITMNLHWDGYGKDHKTAGANRAKMPELSEGFHDYALLWTPEEYVFYVDSKEVWRTKAGGVSQVPEYILVTEEIGDWGGDIKKAELPDFCEVDYVRVYDIEQSAGHTLTPNEAAQLAAKLANAECDRRYQRQPFTPGQHTARLTDTGYRWGGLNEGARGGLSALVTFAPDGSNPQVEVYFSTDAILPR